MQGRGDTPSDGSALRMQELEERTGVPRTTIHYWAREGLLPDLDKTAANAALYGERHVDRVELLDRLREPPLGPLPLPLLRRVIQLVELGVEVEAAVSLERAVLGGLGENLGKGVFSTDELAREADVPSTFIREMREVGLLVPPPGEGERWDPLDAHLVRVCRDLARETGLSLQVAAPISDAIRTLSRYEMDLRNRAVRGLDPGAAVDLTGRIQNGVNLIHAYLFYRWRLHDIAALGAGLQPQEDE